MLKLLRRKSFRKSKDLNSENSFAKRTSTGSSGQYSVRERRRSRDGLQSTYSLTGASQGQSVSAENSNSLDRQRHSRDHARDHRLRSRYSSLSNTVSSETETSPPEIIQYARPPENLSSPVRHSNGYLPTSDTQYSVNPNPGCETTVQKLFFDSVLNGSSRNSSVKSKSATVEASCNPGDNSPSSPKTESDKKYSGTLESPSELRTESVIIRETVAALPLSQPPAQPHPYVRRGSSNNTSNTFSVSNFNNNKSDYSIKHNGDESQNKTGRRSVMTVLRQSFRKSKKDRPVVTEKSQQGANKVSKSPSGVSSHHPRRPSQVSRCPSTEDHSRISVASVRTGRTLTPSRASIVTRSGTSLASPSRNSIVDKDCSGDQTGIAPATQHKSDNNTGKRDSSETSDTSSVNMKTVTSQGSSGVFPMQNSSLVRSMTSKPSSYSTSSSTSKTDTSSTTPSATPRGQRFLPETPKLISSSSAVPPIYANVHSQVAPGNNRQMSPGIAKILEDSGNKRHENGVHRSPSSSNGVSSVSRSPSTSQVPPAIPKPATRMSLRQKVLIFPSHRLALVLIKLLRHVT